MCYRWIDSQRKPLDANYYLQRPGANMPVGGWTRRRPSARSACASAVVQVVQIDRELRLAQQNAERRAWGSPVIYGLQLANIPRRGVVGQD